MILIQQRYTSPDPRREAELQEVRETNSVAGRFSRVELVDPGTSRMSFSDFFRLAAERFPGRTCVIANSDIAFDASSVVQLRDDILQMDQLNHGTIVFFDKKIRPFRF